MSFISTFTFERPTTLEYLDQNGATQTAAVNVPPFAFNEDGSPRGCPWTDDSEAFLADCADRIGQVQGYFFLEFEAPEPSDYFILDVMVSAQKGINKIEIFYTPDGYSVRLNNNIGGSVSGTFDWSGMDRIDIGHLDGEFQPDGYFFRAFGNSKSATQSL